MFEAPLDAWYVWVGVGAVSVVVLGTVLSLPAATAPDATAFARTVDGVAVDPPGAQTTHRLEADRIRLGPQRVNLDGPGGQAHATFAYGPVTPAIGNESLSAVARGTDPAAVYENRSAFADAMASARNDSREWRPAPDRVVVRRVQWGAVDGTLVA